MHDLISMTNPYMSLQVQAAKDDSIEYLQIFEISATRMLSPGSSRIKKKDFIQLAKIPMRYSLIEKSRDSILWLSKIVSVKFLNISRSLLELAGLVINTELLPNYQLRFRSAFRTVASKTPFEFLIPSFSSANLMSAFRVISPK